MSTSNDWRALPSGRRCVFHDDTAESLTVAWVDERQQYAVIADDLGELVRLVDIRRGWASASAAMLTPDEARRLGLALLGMADVADAATECGHKENCE